MSGLYCHNGGSFIFKGVDVRVENILFYLDVFYISMDGKDGGLLHPVGGGSAADYLRGDANCIYRLAGASTQRLVVKAFYEAFKYLNIIIGVNVSKSKHGRLPGLGFGGIKSVWET